MYQKTSRTHPFKFLQLVVPIKGYELKKFLSLFLILFALGFNYSLLRIIKDALVLTASEAGAETIPFIKVWVMLPGAILLTGLFTKLSSYFSREKVFYFIVSTFLLFFLIFTFVLFPNREILRPLALVQVLKNYFPPGLSGFIEICDHWIYTLFYAMAELWGNIVIFLMFWGFSNGINSLDEGKRYYPLLSLAINVSGVAAGLLAVRFVSLGDGWELSLRLLTLLVVVIGCFAMGVFYCLNRFWIPDALKKTFSLHVGQKQEVGSLKKKKMSIGESLHAVIHSPYLFALAIIVLSYNLVINLLEVIWKGKVAQGFPEVDECFIYMANITTYTSLLACFASIFLTGFLVRKAGWLKTALITPLVLLITSLAFFAPLLFEAQMEGILYFVGLSPLAFATLLGSIQNCLSRASKYTVFDVSKELAFNALDYEQAIRGKAAIDGIGTRFGKSGGSVIYQIALLCMGSLDASTPFIALIIFSVITFWMLMTQKLGQEFSLVTKEHITKEYTDSKNSVFEKS